MAKLKMLSSIYYKLPTAVEKQIYLKSLNVESYIVYARQYNEEAEIIDCFIIYYYAKKELI